MEPQPRVTIDADDDGVLILRNPVAPTALERSPVHILLARAALHPDRTLVAEKDPSPSAEDPWQHLTYGQAVAGSRAVAQWLLDHGASVERPLAIVSASSIRHFLMAWGAQMARVPYVPVSYSYSTVPGAHPKLAAVIERVDPAFVFAEDLADHRDAFGAVGIGQLGDNGPDRRLITGSGTSAADDGFDSIPFVELLGSNPTQQVTDSIEAIDHDTVTRYMFTSGSTGMPKGVIHTHGMACNLLASLNSEAPADGGESRVLDWMPWSHVGAGVMRLNATIRDGGSVYLDEGRPVPGQYQATIDNLAVVRPTSYSGSPLGWSMLADALEADDALAAQFFADNRAMASGSAAMPEALADRLGRMYEHHRGEKLFMSTSLLSTEVSLGLVRDWDCDDPEVVGLPARGAEIKLIPLGAGRYELRTRSAGVSPGYLGEADKTAEAFDEDGYFKMGDAVRFLDPDDPDRGLVFAGRVSEDFKLQSGTWVSAGALRSRAVAAGSPWVRDAVICGLNESFVAALVWPNVERCRAIAGDQPIESSSAVHEAIAAGFRNHNQEHPGSSQRIERFLILAEPPDPGAYEITDKGYVNQGEVQRRRSDQVARLYANDPDDGVIGVNSSI